MNSVQNISELVSFNPSHCSDHMPPCIIEDEPDNIDYIRQLHFLTTNNY